MNTETLFDPKRRSKSPVLFFACVAVLVGAVALASMTQQDFGRVAVSNVTYRNFNGIPIRAKLLRPKTATEGHPAPGIVYIHGYQNNRETSDAYAIELARRGFVVLSIDAIGRGNSGVARDVRQSDFDYTYGGITSLNVLKAFPFVSEKDVGMMGHSLGAEMAYRVALAHPEVKALVISGFAYTLDSTETKPKNMLMIMGKWDEFRDRMTSVRDLEKEWMASPQTRKVIPVGNPRVDVTYGDFENGTARRVYVPKITHLQESHSRSSIAEALEWMRRALHPAEEMWIASERQLWPIKEWATLTAMLACYASLLPLGLMLLRTPFFKTLQGTPSGGYACSGKSYCRFALLNGVLIWLYLPLIFVLFGLHIYVARIDRLFPMMMVNGVVWWFLWINIIGFLIFKRWFGKRRAETGLTLSGLGISFRPERFSLDGVKMGKSALLGAILFAFACLSEFLLERIFIVDFRFIFPFASDLTPYRALLFLVYLPFLLIGFVLNGIFLHSQLRGSKSHNWIRTFARWTLSNLAAMVVPIILLLMLQYIPLFTTGAIPFVGPGGMFVAFLHNLFHIVGVLLMVVPLSTWFFQITGKIYLGAFVNALLVTWMFVSSQVIAPIPV